MPILTLAKYTIKGYLKERILLVVLIFGFLLMVASYVLSPLAVGAQRKIVVDIGLAAIPIFGVLLIVLLGAGKYHQEKELGILKSLLVKPITRADFVIGKYLGTVATVIMVLILMAALYLLVTAISGTSFTANIFWAIYLSILEVALVAALLTFYSSFTSPVLGSFFTLCTVVAGHLSKDLLAFADRFTGTVPKAAAHVAFYVLPNLGLFNVRSEAVHGLQLPAGFVNSVTIYCVFYTLTVLFLSALIFRSKEIN
jgi:ABC-type transport system involved in multi-copper enzyme maturation permease subunit